MLQLHLFYCVTYRMKFASISRNREVMWKLDLQFEWCQLHSLKSWVRFSSICPLCPTRPAAASPARGRQGARCRRSARPAVPSCAGQLCPDLPAQLCPCSCGRQSAFMCVPKMPSYFSIFIMTCTLCQAFNTHDTKTLPQCMECCSANQQWKCEFMTGFDFLKYNVLYFYVRGL